MKFKHTEVFNFKGALRGMRNPMNSWDKSDSGIGCCNASEGERQCEDCECSSNWCENSIVYTLGENDLKLAQSLIKAGTDHSKFMRQIMVSVDITAPLYWWKEFDTYRVGVVANSTSTMHKLASTEITPDCFEMDDFNDFKMHQPNVSPKLDKLSLIVESYIETLERIRRLYLETEDKRYWKELVRWLPESWLQTRTITMSYQNIRAMYFARRNHKLTEWSTNFVKWVKSLPYAKQLIMLEIKVAA